MANNSPIVISILNAKGGVGKTTTTVNLGAGLARRGYKVLVIDIDLQANLTHSLIGDLEADQPSIAEALIYETGLESMIRETTTENLYIVPAGETLIGVDINLAGVMGREQVLKNCIRKTKGLEQFDIILIDNPPYISLATVNSLTASTHYLIPVSCEYLPMVGVKLLNENIAKVQEKLNPGLHLLGVLLTMFDKREGITKQVEQILREDLAEAVFKTTIRINTKFKSTPVEKQTIFQYEKGSDGKGSDDYEAATSEVIERLITEGSLDRRPVLRAVGNG
jgi:chromosome partitioning protein